MKCLVTGAAGFIGSHLSEHLLALGHNVTGVDAFIPYYPRALKERNIETACLNPAFTFRELDLRRDNLDGLVAEAEVVYHLAAMPGLMRSWDDFEGYWTCNVLATQRLLDAIRRTKSDVRRFVLGSTSSIYGTQASGNELLPVKPISPYGVTKFAGEQICGAFAETYGLPVVTLRYFSVYGPRQRPDMGNYRFIQALLAGEPVTVFGDGQQVRGNTFVDDCVDATIRAANAAPGEVFNVGGGEAANVWDVLKKLETISGRRFVVRQEAGRPGDQRHTLADTAKIRQTLGWEPATSLESGLTRQYRWQQSLSA
jgi:nucleoside-diphosphate-sugar epimerase